MTDPTKPSSKGKKKKNASGPSNVTAKAGSQNAGSSDSSSSSGFARLRVVLPIAIGVFAVVLSWPNLLVDLLPSSVSPALSLLPNVKDIIRQPRSYIVCSAEGETGIYTVDERNRVVECIGVEGEWIVGSGTLGTFVCLYVVFEFAVCSIDVRIV